jgi:hypothetical protein
MYGNNMFGAYPYMGMQMPAQNPYIPQPINNTTATQVNDSPAVLQVATVKDFDSVTIQPGRRALIMAQNEPYIAFKNADAIGMVQTTLYKIEQVSMDQVARPEIEYATKGELAQLQQVVQQIVDGISPKKAAQKKEAISE